MGIQTRHTRGRDKSVSRDFIEECAIALFQSKGVDKTVSLYEEEIKDEGDLGCTRGTAG